MERSHDTFTDLPAGTPVWFTLAARALSLGPLGQFRSAGTALFHDGGMWRLHAGLGGALSLLVLALLCGTLFVRRLNGFRWWAGLTFARYLTQVTLVVAAKPLPLSLHPFNGALLLNASLILLAKVERCRAQPFPKEIAP